MADNLEMVKEVSLIDFERLGDEYRNAQREGDHKRAEEIYQRWKKLREVFQSKPPN